MLFSIRNRVWTLVLAAALFPVSGKAADVQPVRPAVIESRVKILAPFIDEQTIAVARFDLGHDADDALFALAARLWPMGETPAASTDRLRSFSEKFKAAGGGDVYLVFSVADVPDRPPFLIAPLTKGAREDALDEALATLPYEIHERLGDVMFAGHRETRRRVENAAPSSRPELARAWEVAGNAPYQFVFMPSASIRKVAEELMPILPPGFGSSPTRVFTRGALWASVSVNGVPQRSLRLVVQSADGAAASMLRTQFSNVLPRLWPEGIAFTKAITPELQKDRLLLQLDAEKLNVFLNVLRPAVQTVARLNRRDHSMEQLKQIGLAMHVYLDAHKHFPLPAITDAQGRPLLSWRVALLPQLGQEALYKEFYLDEPWDSEHNRKLIDRMPAVYRSRNSEAAANGTSFVVPVGPGTVFEGSKLSISDITDGTSNTLMAFEVDDEHAVVWTKPDDYVFDPERPSAGLTSPYADGRLTLFCDGHTSFIRQPLDDETLRRLMTRNDGNPVALSP